jgi:hypothetical protein
MSSNIILNDKIELKPNIIKQKNKKDRVRKKRIKQEKITKQ